MEGQLGLLLLIQSTSPRMDILSALQLYTVVVYCDHCTLHNHQSGPTMETATRSPCLKCPSPP